MLVVDDLLEWRGDGDEGPSGAGAGASWDGTALGRHFLREEGRALLVRYFEADGEVQRWSLEDGLWSTADYDDAAAAAAALAPPSPSHHKSGFSARSPSNHNAASSASSPTPSTGSRGQQQQQQQQQQQLNASVSRAGSAAQQRQRYQHREPANLVASAEAEVRHLTPAVLLLLRGLLLLDPAEAFAREADWVYPCVTDLVVVRSLEVRAAVRELLSKRIAPLLAFPRE
ncbi:unnamed protein product [Scytosiphon promiscuus]